VQFQNLVKNDKFVKKLSNIGEHSILCNFSTNIFWGQENSSGRRQNIAQSFAQIFCKIVGKLWEFKILSKLQQ